MTLEDHFFEVRPFKLGLLSIPPRCDGQDISDGVDKTTECWPCSVAVGLPDAQHPMFELKKLIEQLKNVTTYEHGITEQSHSTHGGDDDFDEDSSSDDDSPNDTMEDLEFATKCLVELGPTLHQNLQSAEKARIRSSQPPVVRFCVSGPA